MNFRSCLTRNRENSELRFNFLPGFTLCMDFLSSNKLQNPYSEEMKNKCKEKEVTLYHASASLIM